MIEVNNYIISALEASKNKLSKEAVNHIQDYLKTQLHSDGGFVDRAGVADTYYSMFGYTLAFLFDVNLDIEKEKSFLNKWIANNSIDFIHTVSLLRCFMLIHAIELKSKTGLILNKLSKSEFLRKQAQNIIAKQEVKANSQLLDVLEEYYTQDKGYNQNFKNNVKANVYATFIAWTLFQDLKIDLENIDLKCVERLIREDGSFVNESTSNSGVTTATSAGLIMTYTDKNKMNKTTQWIKSKWIDQGGFIAADDIPIADLLSTSTALLALKIAGESLDVYKEKCQNFVNLHWDGSGGFFGSVADTRPDCEYTYYALLTLGLL